jgi:hypothetical protein
MSLQEVADRRLGNNSRNNYYNPIGYNKSRTSLQNNNNNNNDNNDIIEKQKKELSEQEISNEGKKIYQQILKTKKITLVDSSSVENLTSSDFALDTKSYIGLKRDECVIVTFYIENIDSYNLLSVIVNVTRYAPGNIFAVLNLDSERKVADAFLKLKNDPNNPLFYYSLIQIPCIIVYRNGFPQANYNGPRTTQAISDWVLTLACNSTYKENIQLFSGVKVDPYDNFSTYLPHIRPVLNNSTQFDPTYSIQDNKNKNYISSQELNASKERNAFEGRNFSKEINFGNGEKVIKERNTAQNPIITQQKKNVGSTDVKEEEEKEEEKEKKEEEKEEEEEEEEEEISTKKFKNLKDEVLPQKRNISSPPTVNRNTKNLSLLPLPPAIPTRTQIPQKYVRIAPPSPPANTTQTQSSQSNVRFASSPSSSPSSPSSEPSQSNVRAASLPTSSPPLLPSSSSSEPPPPSSSEPSPPSSSSLQPSSPSSSSEPSSSSLRPSPPSSLQPSSPSSSLQPSPSSQIPSPPRSPNLNYRKLNPR